MKKILKYKKNLYTFFIVLFLPLLTFAEGDIASDYKSSLTTQTSTKDLKGLVLLFIEYLNIAIGLIIALAVITFIWNVYLYFFTEKNREEAPKYVLYSVIGFFVILSFWGLVAILKNTLNLPTQQPTFPFSGGNTGNVTTFPEMK